MAFFCCKETLLCRSCKARWNPSTCCRAYRPPVPCNDYRNEHRHEKRVRLTSQVTLFQPARPGEVKTCLSQSASSASCVSSLGMNLIIDEQIAFFWKKKKMWSSSWCRGTKDDSPSLQRCFHVYQRDSYTNARCCFWPPCVSTSTEKRCRTPSSAHERGARVYSVACICRQRKRINTW
jgi:hypothetical protein